jgi:hypothetical protein
MSNKIPTTEELFNKYSNPIETRGVVNYYVNKDNFQKAILEFAKLHVKAAIAECVECAPSGSSTDTVSYEDVVESLKDCYPESNIV